MIQETVKAVYLITFHGEKRQKVVESGRNRNFAEHLYKKLSDFEISRVMQDSTRGYIIIPLK